MHFFHAQRKISSFYVVVSAGLGHEDRISSRLWGWRKSIRDETAEKDAKANENKNEMEWDAALIKFFSVLNDNFSAASRANKNFNFLFVFWLGSCTEREWSSKQRMKGNSLIR